MIVGVSIRQWSGRKLDRAASDEVAQSKGSQSGRARVNKMLIRKEALLPVQQAAAAIRDHVYRNTVPWGDNGDRALLAAHYLDFMQRFTRLREEFEQRVEELLAEYDREVSIAEFELNELFNPNDYPTKDQIRRAFGVEWSVRPMSDSSHLVLDLEDEVLDEVREKVEADLRSVSDEAMRSVWESVHDQLKELRNRMAEEKPRFKSALVDNFHDLVDRLSALNITGDPELDRLRGEIKQTLSTFDADDLRKPEARKQFVSEADKILGGM